MIQCPWCHEWKERNLKMRIQLCPECSDAWDPEECNGKDGAAIKRPEEATPNGTT